MDKTNINNSTPMEDMTIGGTIYNAGNSREVKTGDWRSMKPIFDSEKCKQCGLCFPVCPENAIPVGKDMKRTDFNYDYCKGCGVCAKVCPFIIVKDVAFVPRFVLSKQSQWKRRELNNEYKRTFKW